METLHRTSRMFDNQVVLYLKGKPNGFLRKETLLLIASSLTEILTHFVPCYCINCFSKFGDDTSP
jgi:hypothetical protein